MPISVDTTAAMTDSAEHEAAAEAPAPPDAGQTPVAAAVAARGALGDKKPAGAGNAVSRSAIVNVVAAALVTAMFSMLMWQISSLGDRIDIQSARIVASATVLRAEIGGLRTEMQAGFREINATLLDHTDRLARLETAAGLPRIVVTPESPDSGPQ